VFSFLFSVRSVGLGESDAADEPRWQLRTVHCGRCEPIRGFGRQTEAAARRRLASVFLGKCDMPRRQQQHRVTRRDNPPAPRAAIENRDCAPTHEPTPGQLLMGDPPVGRSALDRKQRIPIPQRATSLDAEQAGRRAAAVNNHKHPAVRRFDDAEISRLREMAAAGRPNVDIARALGRSPAATLAKAAELGIVLPRAKERGVIVPDAARPALHAAALRHDLSMARLCEKILFAISFDQHTLDTLVGEASDMETDRHRRYIVRKEP
jgi:hypothetical protein